MNNIPQKLKEQWATEDLMGITRVCMRVLEENCAGRITKEHAIIYAGKQLQEEWAILDICAFHHEVDFYQDGGGMNKEKHVWLAFMRAPEERLLALSKATNLIFERNRLNLIYG